MLLKKSIKIPILLFVSMVVISFNVIFAQSHSLFNGKDLTGWHVDVPEMDTNKLARNPFIVRNGLLVSLGTPMGHLITDSVYKNYKLIVGVSIVFAGHRGKYCFFYTFISPTCVKKNVSKVVGSADGTWQ